MNMKRMIALLMAAVFCVCMYAACSKTKPEETTEPAWPEDETTGPAVTDAPTASQPEETTQEESETETQAASAAPATAAQLVGVYESYRCHITVSLQGNNKLSFEVMWGSSATETSVWEMSGEYDPETGVAAYSDCVNAIVSVGEDGAEMRTVNYENGAGRFLFGNGTLTWEDDQEQIADGMEFVLNPNA